MFNRSYIQGHEDHPHYLTNAKVNSLQKSTTFSGDEEELLRIIKNLSDPTKLKIYLILHKVKEIPVTKYFPIAQGYSKMKLLKDWYTMCRPIVKSIGRK